MFVRIFFGDKCEKVIIMHPKFDALSKYINYPCQRT